jgi:hypothetical protein
MTAWGRLVACGASHYWLQPAFGPAGWDCAPRRGRRKAGGRQDCLPHKCAKPQLKARVYRRSPDRADWQSSRSLSSCPTKHRSRNQRLMLLQGPNRAAWKASRRLLTCPTRTAENLRRLRRNQSLVVQSTGAATKVRARAGQKAGLHPIMAGPTNHAG